MKTIANTLVGYATLGCIPVLLTDGRTQGILLVVQAAALVLGIIAHMIAIKLEKNK